MFKNINLQFCDPLDIPKPVYTALLVVVDIKKDDDNKLLPTWKWIRMKLRIKFKIQSAAVTDKNNKLSEWPLKEQIS